MDPEPAYPNPATTTLIAEPTPPKTPAWTRTFRGDDPEQVHAARSWLLALLPGGREHPAAFAAELAVSELATNAELYTRSGDPGGTFRIALRSTPAGIWIGVYDQGSDTEPTMTDADLTDISGRGLNILDDIATTWGHQLTRDGLLVWCIIPGA